MFQTTRRHRQSRRSRLESRIERSIAAVERNGIAATAFKDPAHDVTAPKRYGVDAALAPNPLTSPAASRRMLPSAPLRRLSRQLFARKSYNGGEPPGSNPATHLITMVGT